MKKIEKTFKFMFACIMLLIAFVANIFCERKKKNIWLITELKDMARDNGIAFYHYCRENNKNNVYYIMDKKASDYKAIQYKDHVIAYGSLKHYRYYLKASMLITCFEGATCPSYLLEKILQKYKIVKAQHIFLQHGIIKDYIKNLVYPHYKPDIFITATKAEYEYVTKQYKHPKGVVQLTGLARYDNLKNLSDEKEIEILIMPTWRRWVSKNFNHTEFYQNYRALIKKIEEIYGDKYKILFYLHSNFQRYNKYFQDLDKVKILRSDECKVDWLLKKSNLLITDYSSVAFDFAYMNKPVIYFQFDYEILRKQHYQKGYFDYKKDGFGPVAFQTDEVIKYLKQYEKNKFNNLEPYLERIQQTYTFKDQNNCKRILKIIEEIEGEIHKC